jgi:hypothetical protein
VDALATAGTVFVRDAGGRPEATDLRRALTSALLPPTTRGDELTQEDREVVDWIIRHSRPLYDLTDVIAAREMLGTLATRLDGKSAAATVYRRKRAVLFNMLSYAVERELLPENPMTEVKRTAPKIIEEVDPRVVVNPAQVRRLLTAVTYVGRRNQDRGRTWLPSSPWVTTPQHSQPRDWRCGSGIASSRRQVGVSWHWVSHSQRRGSSGPAPGRCTTGGA